MSSRIINFYKNIGTDSAGRILIDIYKWGDDHLEEHHDYIQWLFPLMEVSKYNHDAPTLSEQDILEFKSDPNLISNLKKSFVLLLNFYGFELHEFENDLSIIKSPSFYIKAQNWLKIYNHNFLRITRILKCLCVLGLHNYAVAFYKVLEEIYLNEYSKVIGRQSYDFWRCALNKKTQVS